MPCEYARCVQLDVHAATTSMGDKISHTFKSNSALGALTYKPAPILHILQTCHDTKKKVAVSSPAPPRRCPVRAALATPGTAAPALLRLLAGPASQPLPPPAHFQRAATQGQWRPADASQPIYSIPAAAATAANRVALMYAVCRTRHDSMIQHACVLEHHACGATAA